MRKRIPENTRLILFNENGEQFIYDIVNMISEEGASCLCYIARKILGEFDSKLVTAIYKGRIDMLLKKR